MFDPSTEQYSWRNSFGIETMLEQDQGADLLIWQTIFGKEKSVRFDSDPGSALFAAILNYHWSEHRSLPEEREIQTVPLPDGRLCYNHLENQVPKEPLEECQRHWLDLKIPQLIEPGRITIAEGEWKNMVGLNLFAYRYEKELRLAECRRGEKKKGSFEIGVVIGSDWKSCNEKGVVWDDKIRFIPEDTQDALRGIYALTPRYDVKILNALYLIAQEKARTFSLSTTASSKK